MGTEVKALLAGTILGLCIGFFIGAVALQGAMEETFAKTECAGYNEVTAKFEIREKAK